MAKIIFICSNPEINNGEQYTPEIDVCVSIKHAANLAKEDDNIIQAIDISDLSDVEDVTQQVAEALTKDLFESCEIVPQYALNVDMHNLLTELEANVAEDTAIERDTQSMYAHGAM